MHFYKHFFLHKQASRGPVSYTHLFIRDVNSHQSNLCYNGGVSQTKLHEFVVLTEETVANNRKRSVDKYEKSPINNFRLLIDENFTLTVTIFKITWLYSVIYLAIQWRSKGYLRGPYPEG